MSPNFWKMSFGRILNKLRPHVKQPELRQTLCLHRRRSMRCTLAELEVLHLCLYCVCLGVESGHIYLAESVDLWKKKNQEVKIQDVQSCGVFFSSWLEARRCVSLLWTHRSPSLRFLSPFVFWQRIFLGLCCESKKWSDDGWRAARTRTRMNEGWLSALKTFFGNPVVRGKSLDRHVHDRKSLIKYFGPFDSEGQRWRSKPWIFPPVVIVSDSDFFFQLYLSFLYRTVFGVGLCFSFFFFFSTQHSQFIFMPTSGPLVAGRTKDFVQRILAASAGGQNQRKEPLQEGDGTAG